MCGVLGTEWMHRKYHGHGSATDETLTHLKSIQRHYHCPTLWIRNWDMERGELGSDLRSVGLQSLHSGSAWCSSQEGRRWILAKRMITGTALVRTSDHTGPRPDQGSGEGLVLRKPQ